MATGVEIFEYLFCSDLNVVPMGFNSLVHKSNLPPSLR